MYAVVEPGTVNAPTRRDHLRVIDDAYTAAAFITTDLSHNQIISFHPGAMNKSATVSVPTDGSISIGIVAPDGRDGMIHHAKEFKDAGIPFIFDPGQGLPLFDAADLMNFVEAANWIAVNDYEAQLIQERTGLAPAELAQRVEALVVTRGGEGSYIYTGGHRLEIPVAKVNNVADPTGCGDAYRAGLLYGLMNKLDWTTTGRIASLLGAIKIEHHGTQNHSFTMDELKQRYQENFGTELTI